MGILGPSFSRPLSSYFYNSSYRWLVPVDPFNRTDEVPFGLNVQLDIGITLLLVVGLLTIVWLRVFGSSRGHVVKVRPVNRPVVIVLILGMIVYLALQLRPSLSFWTAFWQMRVLGYPFRMMGLLLPLALILAIAVADFYLRYFRARWPTGWDWVPASLAVLWLVLFVVLSPITASEPPQRGPYPFTPFSAIGSLTAPQNTTFATNNANALFAEYLPKVRQSNGALNPWVIAIDGGLHQDHKEAGSLSAVPCSIVQTAGTEFESLNPRFRVRCAGTTLFALPISYNEFTDVQERITPTRFKSVKVIHVPTDPRVVISIPRAGQYNFTVHLPTLWRILSNFVGKIREWLTSVTAWSMLLRRNHCVLDEFADSLFVGHVGKRVA